LTFIIFDEVDIRVYQDEDTINISYEDKINYYRVRKEIKDQLAEFINTN